MRCPGCSPSVTCVTVLRTLAAFALLALLASGCAGRPSADKAGGTPERGVIGLAVPDPPNTTESRLARTFAAKVGALSHGSLKVRIAYLTGGDVPDAEARTIDLVRAGGADLGWVAARAWDERGITGFDALQAPFLITNYALLDAVVRSPLAARMLARLARADVVPLTLVPGLLRHPVGLRRLLLAPADYRGARIRDFPSSVADALLRALGAVPVHLAFGDVGAAEAAGRIDGQELAIFPGPPGVLTANVVFFPKTMTLFANRSSFARLTQAQRAAVRAAARATMLGNASFPVRESISFESTLVRQSCAPGHSAALATPPQLAALRRAAQPVYARLAKDRFTAAAISTIRDLAATLPTAPPIVAPRRCLVRGIAPAARSVAGRLNGTYRRVLTAAAARAYGQPATNPGNRYPFVITTVLRDGSWRANSSDPPDQGTYGVSGNRITFTLGADTMRFTFRRDPDGTLHLTPIRPIDPGDAWIMSGAAWRRLGPPIARLP